LGLLVRHAAEVLEKCGQVVPVLEVIKEGLHRDSCAAEDRCAAEFFGINRDEWEPGALCGEGFHLGKMIAVWARCRC